MEKWNRRGSLLNWARKKLGGHSHCANCSTLIMKYSRTVKGNADLGILLDTEREVVTARQH